MAITLTFAAAVASAAGKDSAEDGMVAIAIHGGAGSLDRAAMTPAREAAYRAGLEAALDAGYAVLAAGGSSLDAVTTAVRMLEDDPQFNAGRGAVLTHDGAAELDASIMDGNGLRAGAVAGVRHVRNPIELARLVLEKSVHVMLAGPGAEEFALEQGMTLVPNEYFHTPARQRQLERALSGRTTPALESGGLGTVGAVARDRYGHLAAATSTGGMTNKRHGRIGDSPIIGAGTYADDATCAVSSTGHGEFFIRAAIAHDICARVAYGGVDIAAAARAAIHEKLAALGGDGGVIAIGRDGAVVLEFNSQSMFRGVRTNAGRRDVAIWREADR